MSLIIIVILLYIPVFIDAAVPNVSSTNKLINQYFMDGLNFYLQRDFKNASELWQKVLELEPSHSRARIYFEKAFKKYQNMEINFYHGLKLYTEVKYRDAVVFFKKALFVNPRHSKALYYLKLCYALLEIKLKIADKPSKDGKIIKDLNITTDDELVLYAIGFDGTGKYIGPIKVNWNSTGTLDPIVNKEPCVEIKIAPGTFGTEGTVAAFLDEDIKAETGKIIVNTGRLHYVKIIDASDFMGKEVKKIDITSDDTKKLYAAGFDKNDVYIGDVPVDWDTSGDMEKLNLKNSSVFEFKSRKAGKGKIIIKAKNKTKTEIKDILVTHGKLAYLQIEDSPSGEGEEIYTVNVTTDDKKIFYSIGYDAYDNLIGNVKAKWKTTGTLEQFNTYDSEMFVYEPKVADVYGTIKADIVDVVGDETGLIKVFPGRAKKVYIVNTPDRNAEILNRIEIKAGEKTYLYAVGFDDKNKFINKYNVQWNIIKDGHVKKINNSDKAGFYYTKAPDEIKVDLFHSKVKAQSNFIVIIKPNDVDKFIISEYNNKPSSNLFVISADSEKKFFGYITDKYDNYIETVSCEWTLKNLSGTVSAKNKSSTIFYPDKAGKGKINAEYFYGTGAMRKRYSSDININVIPGDINNIIVYRNNEEAGSNINIYIGDELQLTSYSEDKKGNLIGRTPVKWIVKDSRSLNIVKENTDFQSLKFDNAVSNGNIIIIKDKFKKDINFNVLYRDIAKLGLMRYNDRVLITNILLRNKEKIKLLAVRLDENNNCVKDENVFWNIPGREEVLKYKQGVTNILEGDGQALDSNIVLSKPSGITFKGYIKILPPEIVTKEVVNKIASKNIILYYVYNGDSLSKIIAKILNLPYKWKKIYKYVRALVEYNKIKDMDLIFPKQEIYIPYFTVDNNTTRKDLARKLFNDETKEKAIIIYNKKGDLISPEDKIVILDEDFLREGRMKVSIIKQEIKN